MGMTEGWVRGAGMLLLALLLLCCTVPFVTAGPATDEDWYREGNNWTNQKRYDLAIQAYDQALALNPGYARAYFARGQALASLGMHRDALEASLPGGRPWQASACTGMPWRPSMRRSCVTRASPGWSPVTSRHRSGSCTRMSGAGR